MAHLLRIPLLFFLALQVGRADDLATQSQVQPVAQLIKHAKSLHDQPVEVVGRVRWSKCNSGTCLIELTDEEDPPSSLLARLHGDLPLAEKALAGRQLQVEGLFYQKVYPRYRMAGWQESGWRDGESLPEAALVQRLTAHQVRVVGQDQLKLPAPPPLVTWDSPLFELEMMEMERAGTSAGRKCLDPEASTPKHSTGAAQEFLYGLEGTLTVIIADEPVQLKAATLVVIPPMTPHNIDNVSKEQACYLFVASAPHVP